MPTTHPSNHEGYDLKHARIAAILTWTYTAAFGAPAIPVALYLRDRGTLPMFNDLFYMYGGPWSDRVDHDTFIGLLVLFFVVALVAAWVAWLLWKGSRSGAILALSWLPVEAVFWLGFALPIPWVFAIARAALIAAAWRTLSPRPATVPADR